MHVHMIPAAEIHSISASMHHYYYGLGTPELISSMMVDFLMDHIRDKRQLGEIEPSTLKAYFNSAGLTEPNLSTSVDMLASISSFLEGYIDRFIDFPLTGITRISARVTLGNLVFSIHYAEPDIPYKAAKPEDLHRLLISDIIALRDKCVSTKARSNLRSLARVGNNIKDELECLSSLAMDSVYMKEEVNVRTEELMSAWVRAKVQWFPK